MTEVERFLSEYGDAKKRVCELEVQIEELEAKKDAVYDRLLSPTPPRSERVTGGPLYEPIIEAVAQLVDVYVGRIRRVTLELAEANAKLAKIEDLVNQAELTEIELRYVRFRYFDGLPAWKVAQQLGFTESRARDYKTYALRKIGDHRRFFLVS